MRLPGPFEIHRVVEFEWPGREPGFLLRGVTAHDLAQTRTARDARFVDPRTGLLVMSFHSLVVRTPAGTLLVDTCVGNDKDRPSLPEWHQQRFPYLERLNQAGLAPEDVDFVCCTHLHADHMGWNTRLENGRWVPTFPNARYLFAAGELAFWEAWHAAAPDNPYIRAWQDSLLPVREAGQVEAVAYGHEPLPGVRFQHAPGHTPGNVVIDVDDGRQRAVLSGDVIHHPVQIERVHWCSQFDIDPLQALDTRRGLLERVADTGTWVMGAHFAGPAALQVVRDADGFFYADA